MQLNLDLKNMDASDIAAAIGMLQSLLAAPPTSQLPLFPATVQPTVTNNGGSSEPVQQLHAGDPAVAATSEAVSAATEVAASVKKERKKVTKAVEPPPFDGVEDAQMAAAAVAEETLDLSLDSLRAALQNYSKTAGLPAAVELLRKYGAARVTELADKSDADKAAFVAECKGGA